MKEVVELNLIEVNKERCIRCGICVKICPVRALELKGAVEAVAPEACISCGHCVAVCPQSALDHRKSPLARQVALSGFPVIAAAAARQFLRSRRSIRSYKEKAVPREKLVQLIDIGRFAATASNSQGVSYTVVEDKAILRKATELMIEWMEAQDQTTAHWSFSHHIRAYRQGLDPILRDAPHLILATTVRDHARGRENTVFALAYVELYAPVLGLGTCWAGLLEMGLEANYVPLMELFKIPAGKAITGALMAGYPEHHYQRLVDRNPLEISWLS